MAKVTWFLVSWVLTAMILLASLSGRRRRGGGYVGYDYRKKPATWSDIVAMLVVAGVIAWFVADHS